MPGREGGREREGGIEKEKEGGREEEEREIYGRDEVEGQTSQSQSMMHDIQ